MLEQPARADTHQALVEARKSLEEDGKLLAKVYNEPAVFEMEKDNIFTKTWMFLAHETELPDPGDYVVRRIVGDSFIISRDEHGEIHVLFNMCRHRGMQLCRVDSGNTSHFRCPYHGWTYRNTGKLNGAPFQKEAYGKDGLDKEEWAMTPAPAVGVYKGMIFASMSSDVPPIEEYIGGMGWYLDFYLNKTSAGSEVIGAPQRWVLDADWKLAAENFFGDGYHTQSAHMSTIKAGIMRVKKAAYFKDGVQYKVGPHGGMFIPFKPGSFFNYPQNIVDGMRENLGADQFKVLEEDSILPLNATVFPNLSFLHSAMAVEPEGQSIPYLTIRLWQPLGPGKIEVWSWGVVEADASEEFKQKARRAYLTTFGASGTFEQDDAENWRSVTRVAAGEMADHHYLNYQMGLDHVEPIPDEEWPGPGTAYARNFADFAQQRFWRTYFSYLLGDTS